MIFLMHPILANVAVDIFLKGGPIMWPILACLIAALVVVAERGLWWWHLNRRCREAQLREPPGTSTVRCA